MKKKYDIELSFDLTGLAKYKREDFRDRADTYAGETNAGSRNGLGKLFGFKTISQKVQTSNLGGLQEHFDLNSSGVLQYEGHWLNNLPHGEGKSYYWHKTGSILVNWLSYQGNWRNGYREGFGKMTRHGFADEYYDIDTDEVHSTKEEASWYEGEWHENLPHGEGKIFIKDKLSIEGHFWKGEVKGYSKIYDEQGLLRFEGIIDGMLIPPTKEWVCYFDDESTDLNYVKEDPDFKDHQIPSWLSGHYRKINRTLIFKEGKFFTSQGRVWFEGRLSAE